MEEVGLLFCIRGGGLGLIIAAVGGFPLSLSEDLTALG